MSDELIELTASIVASYVENNRVSPADLPALIRTTYDALTSAGQPALPVSETSVKATPAQIRKSISSDALTSFEDGRPYKSMKRHLTLRGLTPAAYREKWGLPADYPMVSPAYSAARSAMAKAAGLGSAGRGAPPISPTPQTPKAQKAGVSSQPGPAVKGVKAKLGRPAKAIKPEDESFT